MIKPEAPRRALYFFLIFFYSILQSLIPKGHREQVYSYAAEASLPFGATLTRDPRQGLARGLAPFDPQSGR